jgi:hypothetical protein
VTHSLHLGACITEHKWSLTITGDGYLMERTTHFEGLRAHFQRLFYIMQAFEACGGDTILKVYFYIMNEKISKHVFWGRQCWHVH